MLNVYIDNTGSMAEMGKLEVAKYVAYALESSFKDRFYTLDGKQIQNLNNLKIQNFKDFDIKDCGILLSDGLIEQDLPKNSFEVALGIGVDCNISVLKSIAKNVFNINEILSFLAFIDSINSSSDNEDSEWEQDSKLLVLALKGKIRF